jgi:hypothetical protein
MAGIFGEPPEVEGANDAHDAKHVAGIGATLQPGRDADIALPKGWGDGGAVMLMRAGGARNCRVFWAN